MLIRLNVMKLICNSVNLLKIWNANLFLLFTTEQDPTERTNCIIEKSTITRAEMQFFLSTQ